MVLPLRVDDLEHDVALDLVEDRRIGQQRFLLFVLLQRQLPDGVGHLVRRLAGEVQRGALLVVEAVDFRRGGRERVQVPLLGVGVRGRVGGDGRFGELLGERHEVAARVHELVFRDVDLPLEQLAAQRVDALALLVHHVVVFEEVLADGEVLRLDLLLRALDRLGHHLVLDGDAFLHAEARHQAGDAIRPEDAHQVVFEREVEARRARVSLAAGAAAQLVVDAPRLVALGRDDVQAAQGDHFIVLDVGRLLVRRENPLVRLPGHAVEAVEVEEVDEVGVVDELLLPLGQTLDDLIRQRLLARHELGVAAQQDVGAAARHVGGDRDRVLAARLRDDLRFLRVELGVEDDVPDAAELEQLRQPLRLFNRDRADQGRAAELLLLDDVEDDRVVLLPLGPVDAVRLLDPPQHAVGRDHHDVELVDAREFLGLGVGRARHARQLLVLAEVVLEGDGRERLVLALDLDFRMVRVVFLGFHRLVQAVAPAAPGHQAARELVHDHDGAVLHHVLHVEVEQRVRAQRLVDVVEELHVLRVVQPVGAGLETVGEHLLGLRHPALGQVDRLVLLVDDVVAGLLELFAIFRLDVAARHPPLCQFGDDVIDLVIEVRGLLGRAGDDERRPRFVDQDGVDLVHDRELVPALHVVREVELHVVAQVVEAELVVRAVGDVGGVGDLPLGVVEIVLDDADAHAEEPVDAAHPLGVAARQVVVDGDDVHALARERVEIGGQGGDERLAFARLHLRDLPAVEHHAADELHVEVPHVQHAAAGLTDDRERLGQQLVERVAVGQPRAELGGLVAELRIGEGRDGGFVDVDLDDERRQALELALIGGAEDFCEGFVDDHRMGIR